MYEALGIPHSWTWDALVAQSVFYLLYPPPQDVPDEQTEAEEWEEAQRILAEIEKEELGGIEGAFAWYLPVMKPAWLPQRVRPIGKPTKKEKPKVWKQGSLF